MQNKTERRTPAQQRSRERVSAILAAAKALISEKGAAQLKIQDIAARAGVTPASIYQYFDSKQAITHALAERLFSGMHEMVSEHLPKADTVQEAYEVLRQLVERLYQVYLDDPALYDVWVSISADKSVQAIDLEDSRRTAELTFESLKPFYDEQHWERISQASFMLAHLAGSAVRMAVTLDEREGRAVMDSFKAIIQPGFVEMTLESKGEDVE